MICVNCGVELEDGLVACPLCGMDQEKKDEKGIISDNYPSGIIRLQKEESRKYLWELSGIIAFSAIAICIVVDLLISRGMKWSLYAAISILETWIIATVIMISRRNVPIMLTGIMLTILAALLAYDLVESGLEWFFPVGLPMTAGIFAAAGLVAFLCKISRYRGFNIIAAALVIVAGLCMLMEIALDRYIDGAADLRWSLIAATSIFPVAMIFAFFHYRMKKGKQLDSFFHV